MDIPHLKVPSTLVLIAIASGALWSFDLLFKLSFKPAISVVAWTKDSNDLSFEDQMYAEKFVELNRCVFALARGMRVHNLVRLRPGVSSVDVCRAIQK